MAQSKSFWSKSLISPRLVAWPVYANRLVACMILHSMALFLKSGHSLVSAGTLTCEKKSIHGPLKKGLSDFIEKLSQGCSFSEFLNQYRWVFTPSVVAIVKESEKAGMLIEGLTRAGLMIRRDLNQSIGRKGFSQYQGKVLLILLLVNHKLHELVLPAFEISSQSLTAPVPVILNVCRFSSRLLLEMTPLIVVLVILVLLIRIGLLRTFMPLARAGKYLAVSDGLYIAGEALAMGRSLSYSLKIAGKSTGSFRLARRFTRAAEAVDLGQPPEMTLVRSGILPEDLSALFLSRGVSSETFHSVADFLSIHGQVLTKRQVFWIISLFYLFVGFFTFCLLGNVYFYNSHFCLDLLSGVIK